MSRIGHNYQAEEDLAVPEFLTKAADGSRNVESVIKIVVF